MHPAHPVHEGVSQAGENGGFSWPVLPKVALEAKQ